MVHLSVAHCLVQDHAYPASPAFYLGNIAPDAIHMRPGTDQQDKYVVHLVDQDGLHREQLHALLAQGGAAQPAEKRAFISGYAAHILTDVAWRAEVILPFRRPRVERMPYAELRTLYYNECDKLDYDLYDEQPWRPEVWELLRRAQAEDVRLGKGDPLLTAAEIDAWRVRTLGWFDPHRGASFRGEAAYQPQYITRAQVRPFVPQTAASIAAQLPELRRS
jgi:hypothetical protein